MQIGPYKIELLPLGRFRMDGGGLFGIIPKKLWSRAYNHVDDDNRVELASQALLIRGAGMILVADSGLGDKLEEKARSIFAVDQQPGALVRELGLRGIAPQDVTHFVYTHLHFDHAGGATQFNSDGAAEPVFPQARHLVQRSQLDWARNPSDKDRASFHPHNWEPVANIGLLETLGGNANLAPGMDLRVIDGHTTGMQMIAVHDSTGGFVYTVDLFPTAAHLPPHYVAAFDNVPLLTLKEKRNLLEEVTEKKWVLGFGHDPFTPAVRLAADGRAIEHVERLFSG